MSLANLPSFCSSSLLIAATQNCISFDVVLGFREQEKKGQKKKKILLSELAVIFFSWCIMHLWCFFRCRAHSNYKLLDDLIRKEIKVISYAIGDIFSDKLLSKQLMKTLFITFYDAMPSIFYPSIKKSLWIHFCIPIQRSI